MENDINEKIRADLFKMQDIKFREFSKSLCTTSKYEMIGVRTPDVRKYAKSLLRENYMEFLNSDNIKYYEEELLKGILIGELKAPIDDVFKYLKDFVPTIDNWAVCDCLCASLKCTNKNMDEMWNFLQKYIKSDREYEIRFALVMYLDYFIDVKYLGEIFCQIEGITNKEYYVKMAIAWFLAESFIKERNLTLDFLERAKIDGWTYNKALQKIVESYRVSEGDKDMARKMKK